MNEPVHEIRYLLNPLYMCALLSSGVRGFNFDLDLYVSTLYV